ncbi:hypothetical protein F511_37072 [Dorcoceras hygrometricum]|uniref:Abscisic acid receptor PYL8-like n=1 Tax=Dorcoceras hygrometricum TaxID=472368 RepID=A0A2Z7DAX6_9LAMI|nr:hypothetical protein F511_37072 [Dorcoceras hygrometricum]
MMNVKGLSGTEIEYIRKHHQHEITDNQCNSFLIKHIRAPIHLIGSGVVLFVFGDLTGAFWVDSDSLTMQLDLVSASGWYVWSLVRRFDQPQKYKPFVSRCVVQGNLEIGSLREVDVKSGLPATTSTERLELLDDEEHILSVRIIGGDHRLRNYSSIVSVHPEVIEGRPGTMVIESFVVDVPEGNTKDETCFFVEALIKCNLKSLADVSERLAVQDRTEPIDHD